MKRYIAAIAMMIVALSTPGRAQEPRPTVTSIAFKVQVVLSRVQQDKKITSLPYTLIVSVDDRGRTPGNFPMGRANLRLGTQVPITTMQRQGSENNSSLVPTVTYRDAGTSIDASITMFDDARFKVDLTIEDSSLEGALPNTSHPAFRSFRTGNSMVLRDGQSAQYTAATDKVTGDVWKVDVTVNVVK